MKKLFVILFVLVMCVLMPVGCNNKQDQQNDDKSSETQSEINSTASNENQSEADTSSNESPFSAKCIVKKGNRYVIVLPISGKSIPVDKSCVKHLSFVTDELVFAAEEKITEQIKSLDDDPYWQICPYGDKAMCLMVEVVKSIEGADEMEQGGCGIDHEHIFFAESIIMKEQ